MRVSKHGVVMEPPGHFKHKTYKIHKHTARSGAQWNLDARKTHRHMWMHVIGRAREKRKIADGKGG